MRTRGVIVRISSDRPRADVRLEDGRMIVVTPDVCPDGLPLAGAPVEVELGSDVRGGARVKRVHFESARVQTAWPGVVTVWPAHGEPGRIRVRGDTPRAPTQVRGVGAMRYLDFSRDHWKGEALAEFGEPVDAVVATEILAWPRSGRARIDLLEIWPSPAVHPVHRELLVGVPEALRVTYSTVDEAYDPQTPPRIERRRTAIARICDGGASDEATRSRHACSLCGGRPARDTFCRTAEGEKDVEVVCDACVIGGKTRRYPPAMFETYVARAHPDLAGDPRLELVLALARVANRTPYLVPAMQEPDWAICCDELADYLGHPKGRPSFDRFVGDGAREQLHGAVIDDGLLAGGEPEDWCEVNCFVCATCAKRWFTYQGL
jgi:hypothetical protein